MRDSKEQKAIADEVIAILKKHEVTIGELNVYLAYNPFNDTAVIGTSEAMLGNASAYNHSKEKCCTGSPDALPPPN